MIDSVTIIYLTTINRYTASTNLRSVGIYGLPKNLVFWTEITRKVGIKNNLTYLFFQHLILQTKF